MNEHLLNILRFVKRNHYRRLIAIIFNYQWIGLSIFLVTTFLLQILFAIIPLSIFIYLWDLAFVLLIISILSITIYKICLKPPSLISTARIIEKSSGIEHPLLSLAIELFPPSDPKNELYEDLYRKAFDQLNSLPKVVTCSINKKKVFSLLIGIISVSLFSFFIKPSIVAYWKLPLLDMSKGNFIVSPGSIIIPKFSSVELKLSLRGVSYPSAELIISEIGKVNRRARLLRAADNESFSYSFDSIENSFVYYFILNGRSLQPETIQVAPDPYLSTLQIELIPPAYSKVKPEKLSSGQGDFAALSGTVAKFYLESPYLRTAKIFYDKDTILLNRKGNMAFGEMIVRNSGEYTIFLEDTFFRKNENAGKYYVKVITDEVPFVNFIKPTGNKILEPAQIETLLVECADDFGIRSLEIFYFKKGEEYIKPSKIDLSPEKPISFYEKLFIWKIFKLSLYPNDTLYYWARVTDNKYNIPQIATTDTFWFRVPSFGEIHKKIAGREEEAKSSLKDVVKGQRELMKNLDNIKRELMSSKKSGWEREEIAKKIEKIVAEQIDSLKESVKKLEENIEQLNKEGNIGEEILKKMEEVQKALHELIDMYGDSLIFKRNNNEEISLNEMKEAIDRMRERLPELNERLENTLKYLETLKRDRELAELAMKAEKLAEEQSLLSQKNLENLNAKERELLKKVDELKKEIEKRGELSLDSTLQNIDSLRKEMENQLSEGKTPSPSQMNRMSAELGGLASELRQKMTNSLMEQIEALKKKLFDISGQTLTLLDWQHRVRSIEGNKDEDMIRRVKQQKLINEAVNYLKNTLDSLTLLPLSARKVFNSDLRDVHDATSSLLKELGERSNYYISFENSHRAMKRFVSDILDFINQIDKQESGGQCNSGCASLRDGLRRLSGKQAAINAATAELLRDLLKGKGGRRTRGEKGSEEGGGEGNGINEKARREAQEAQERLAEELKKLGEKFGGVSSEEMRRRVEELEKEARNISRMLDEPKEEITERQDRFLSRMLQAALSLHREEDEKEERKSTSAKVVFDASSQIRLDTLLINKQDVFYLLRRKAIEMGNYPSSYKLIINTYFDSLRSAIIGEGK